jgi:hypothetical protein
MDDDDDVQLDIRERVDMASTVNTGGDDLEEFRKEIDGCTNRELRKWCGTLEIPGDIVETAYNGGNPKQPLIEMIMEKKLQDMQRAEELLVKEQLHTLRLADLQKQALA